MSKTPVVEIKIVVGADGQMTVSAPFDNDILCYGLFEKAKLVVGIENEKLRNRLVQPAQAVDKTFLQKLHLRK
jgi:hypothetical protein